MAKICIVESCSNPVFSKGMCVNHIPRKPIKQSTKPLKQTPLKKSTKPIKQVSVKQQKNTRTYTKVRSEWMQHKDECEAKLNHVCTGLACEVHHMEGREGDLLLDTDKWLAVCHACHRWITDNSGKAIAMGLSLRRNI